MSLEPHEDLNDFFLLRGDRDQLARLRVSDECRKLGERASMVLWGFRIVGTHVGQSAWTKIERFEED